MNLMYCTVAPNVQCAHNELQDIRCAIILLHVDNRDPKIIIAQSRSWLNFVIDDAC